MDILKNLNKAAAYLEENLLAPDMEKAAALACTSTDGFNRIFSYLVGISITEYLRRRRLTKAAYELQRNRVKVLDLALKYGYDSSDSFTRAFTKQHGITPTAARRPGAKLTVYPPISFHILLKGNEKMDCRIVEKESFRVSGFSRQFTGEAANRWDQEHELWTCDIPPEEQIKWTNGSWYGIWNHGEYIVARAAQGEERHGPRSYTVKAGKYAVFESGFGGFAGTVLPELRKRIFEEWLPDSGYEAADEIEIEVYHLYGKEQKAKRHYELWIPIK